MRLRLLIPLSVFMLSVIVVTIGWTQPLGSNIIQLLSEPSGTAPQIKAHGSDTNIDVNVVPKGTGCLRVSGGACVTGGGGGANANGSYITVNSTNAPTNYRLLTAGTGISLTDNAGAHTMTITSTGLTASAPLTPGTLPVATGAGTLGDSALTNIGAGSNFIFGGGGFPTLAPFPGHSLTIVGAPGFGFSTDVNVQGGHAQGGASFAVGGVFITGGESDGGTTGGDVTISGGPTLDGTLRGGNVTLSGGTGGTDGSGSVIVTRLDPVLLNKPAPVDAVAATASITDGNAVNVTAGKTVVVNGTATYTFVNAVAVNGDVLVGIDADTSTQNLADAINNACAGNCQVAGANADVTASGVVAHVLTVTAVVKGVSTVTLTSDEPTYTISVSPLGGGVDGTPCSQGELRASNASPGNLYFCTTNATVATSGAWKKVTLGSL